MRTARLCSTDAPSLRSFRRPSVPRVLRMRPRAQRAARSCARDLPFRCGDERAGFPPFGDRVDGARSIRVCAVARSDGERAGRREDACRMHERQRLPRLRRYVHRLRLPRAPARRGRPEMPRARRELLRRSVHEKARHLFERGVLDCRRIGRLCDVRNANDEERRRPFAPPLRVVRVSAPRDGDGASERRARP